MSESYPCILVDTTEFLRKMLPISSEDIKNVVNDSVVSNLFTEYPSRPATARTVRLSKRKVEAMSQAQRRLVRKATHEKHLHGPFVDLANGIVRSYDRNHDRSPDVSESEWMQDTSEGPETDDPSASKLRPDAVNLLKTSSETVQVCSKPFTLRPKADL